MDGGRGRVLFDASAYMLFEATGDSEVECIDGTIPAEFEYLESDAGADDDAQSCSYGSLTDTAARVHEIDEDGDGDGDGDGDDRFHNYCSGTFVRVGDQYFSCEGEEDPEEEDDYGDNDEEDGVVDQCCRCCVVAPPANSIAEAKKSNGTCDRNSKVKVLNGRERDRLFWENCLAS